MLNADPLSNINICGGATLPIAGEFDLTVIDRVKEGFIALDTLPEYYQYLLFIAISSSFGIKGVSKIMELRK